MNREKKLFKNTIILTLGNICTKLITFFLLPLYTAVLSTEEYGIVDLLNTLVSLLLPIITFQIEQAVFRNLIDARENENQKKTIISTCLFTVAIQCILYIIIFICITNFIHNEYKWFLVSNLIAYVFTTILQQIARGLGDNKTYAVSSFLSAISTIAFNLLFILKFNLAAYGMLLGTALGQIICCIYCMFKLKLIKYISIQSYNKKELKNMWKYSIPLIPNSISWWIINASDRIIVSSFLGISMNGILAASHKFSAIYITFYNIFHLSWLESISVHINNKDISKFYNKTINTVINLFLSIGIMIIAVMPFVYSIMIDADYYEGYYIVPITILSSIFNILIALETAIYVAKKNTKSISYQATLSAIINIIVHLMLIKFIGLYAATVSTLVAFALMFIYRHIDVNKKYFKITFNNKTIISTIIILSILLPIYYTKNIFIHFIGLILAIIYSYLLNRKSIFNIIDIVKKKLKGKEE